MHFYGLVIVAAYQTNPRSLSYCHGDCATVVVVMVVVVVMELVVVVM